MGFLTTLPYTYFFAAVLLFVIAWWVIMRLRRTAGIWRLRYYALPRPWLLHVHRHVPLYARVPLELRAPYQDKVLQFVDGKNFRNADPMKLVEEDARLTLAGTASLLLLNDSGACYPDLLAVQLWPVGTTQETIEASARPVKSIPLIWDEASFRAYDPRDVENKALPGIAKALGWEAAGRSQMPETLLLAPWSRLRFESFHTSHAAALAPFEGDPSDVFAVATEMFYAAPALLQNRHSKLYDALRHFYCIDPVRWKTNA